MGADRRGAGGARRAASGVLRNLARCRVSSWLSPGVPARTRGARAARQVSVWAGPVTRTPAGAASKRERRRSRERRGRRATEGDRDAAGRRPWQRLRRRGAEPSTGADSSGSALPLRNRAHGVSVPCSAGALGAIAAHPECQRGTQGASLMSASLAASSCAAANFSERRQALAVPHSSGMQVYATPLPSLDDQRPRSTGCSARAEL